MNHCKRALLIVMVIALAAALATAGVLLLDRQQTKGNDVYSQLCKDGYTGTAEVFIASLVGETATSAHADSAYSLACENGYTGTIEDWMKTVANAEHADKCQSTYSAACENGYSGSLTEWLQTLVPDPDALGRSSPGNGKTDYEYACDFGFEGSFIQWMVSLIHE